MEENALTITGLKKRYAGGNEALKGVSFCSHLCLLSSAQTSTSLKRVLA
ncbi:MAG: hypothetical protein Q7R59_01645 [bacterium]|nr:hypothetical protein [bacterium]